MDPLTQNQKWSCGYCTYENWPATKKCVLCRAPKPPQYIDEDVPIEQDIYKMAPLVYPDSIGPCSSSTHTTSSITQPVVSSDPASKKWTCQTCTYLNWPKASKCTQCLTARPRSAVAGSSVSPTQPLSIDVNIAGSSVSAKNSPSSPEAAKAINNDKNRAVATVVPRSSNPPPAALASKWPCRSCTYENWMRSLRCVLCGVPRSEGAVAGLQRETTAGEKESNRSGGGKKKQRRSPMSSMHNLVDTIESFHHPGGATASPSIHLERQQQQIHPQHQHQQIHPQQIQTQQTESFSSNIRKKDDRKMRQFRNRLRDLNWLWLNACQGVVNGDPHAVEAYLASGGDPTRQLTANESELLSRPSAFTVGHTLIHLALRFNREDILSALLATPEAASKARKRVPSYVAPDLAAEIVRDIARALRQRKGDFPCYFLTDYSTFALPTDVEDLPNEVRKQLFEELLDCNVQKELEDDEPVINWSSEITDRLGSRLYPLWNRTAGDCLLDSVLQACWGIMDRDNTLRHALADSLNEGAMLFYRRWKETESIEAELLNFSLEESQWEQEWAELLSLASQPGASLEQVHIFALAHILRRPIIVYGIKFVKSYHGDNIDLARFQGVYLPLFWEQSFCWHVPIALGYTRGHFAALVPMEVDIFATTTGAQANISNNDDDDDDDDDVPIAYLPLMDYEGKVLPIHFLQPSEIGHEQSLLSEWLDCCFTEGGLLVAKQRLTKPPILVRQMVDEWLQRYRSVTNAHIHQQHHQQHQQSSHASITPSSMITPSLLPSVVMPIAPRTTTTSPSGGEGLSSDDDTDDE